MRVIVAGAVGHGRDEWQRGSWLRCRGSGKKAWFGGRPSAESVNVGAPVWILVQYQVSQGIVEGAGRE